MDVGVMEGLRPWQKTASEERLPQGIIPRILLEHVKNTSPYLFEWRGDLPPHIRTLQKTGEWIQRMGPDLTLDHPDYFELCVSAHWATVATFVPTDVDNQIRFRLWHPAIDLESLSAMTDTVVRSREWPWTQVSARWVKGPKSGFLASGHNGEWFSIAAGAYGCLKKKIPKRAEIILNLIEEEISFEEKLITEFLEVRDGVGLLKATAVAIHNIGDLQRVIDMWEQPEDDPLRKLLASRTEASSLLWKTGELYKKMMAPESHRHFPLRRPKCLRKSSDLLVPLAPFLDDWGRLLAKHPSLTPENIGEIATALIDGWVYLKTAVGYSRALAGIENSLPGGLTELSNLLPSRLAKTLKTGNLRLQISQSQERFEGQWAASALKFWSTLKS
jgi:hypothetical protein